MIAMSLAVRNARLQQIADALDAGATPGKVQFYTGTRPAPGDATLEVLQATALLNQPCAEVEAAVLTFTFTPPVEGMRLAADAVTWCRFLDGDDVFVMDATVTAAGDGGDVIISEVNGLIGGFVRLDTGTLAE